jgi:hypothetical protein
VKHLAALGAALLFFLAAPFAGAAAGSPYAICTGRTYALCAAASAFVYQDVSYAKCIIKNGNSISAPPLSYRSGNRIKNICNMNAEGVANGYMMSTFSLPDEVKKGGSKALYTCPGGATGAYAQCDGGTCFKSTSGKYFPGVGQLGADEIICSCPMTKPTTANAPFGYQFIGAYPCQQQAFSVCSQNVVNGTIIPVGSPPGAGRVLTEALYGQQFPINECSPN